LRAGVDRAQDGDEIEWQFVPRADTVERIDDQLGPC